MSKLPKGDIKMVAKEPIEVLVSLPERVQEVVLALSITINRIDTLNCKDREDLFQLMMAWGKTGEMEERMDIRRAMIEILTQGEVNTRPIPLAGNHPVPTSSKNWGRHVGKKIRELREKAGLTQEELSGLAGLPQSHISRLETATHTATHMTLQKIAKALNVTVGDLDPCAD